jgi:hypothetical protein
MRRLSFPFMAPRFIACASLLVAGAGGAASCTTPATELVAGMTTQIQVPRELAAVGVVVRYGGELVSCRSYGLVDGTVTLPSTLGMVPQEGREGQVLEPVTVTVLGFRTTAQGQLFDDTCVASIPGADEPEVLVIRSRRMPYADERILYMPMPLRESCAAVQCPEEETCIGGKCEALDLDPAQAVDYQDSLVFGDTNTCFSASLCLPSGPTLPAVLTDFDTCTFRYPELPDAPPIDAKPGTLNVEIVYHSMGTEILDLDDKEGFVFPDESDPLTFRLAQNLCESNYHTGKIIAVRAAPLCPAKRALQPICTGDLTDIQAGGRSPQSSLPEPMCTIGEPLTPSESALYVLLDRSASMADLYGPDGVAFAIGVPLRNPVAARTRLAFSFLPGEAADCAASSYETPDIPFDDVETVRGPIADLLGDAASLLPDDPMLMLDGALPGAYDALLALTPVESAQFNRRAVIVVGNRDLQGHCTPTALDPSVLAQSAQTDDGLFTYVAVLEAPASAPQFGDDPQVSGAAIAAAGGTEVFDAIADESEGALAVQKVLNDLGSCVYDAPANEVAERATHLAFVDPVTLARTDIAKDDACDGEAASGSVDGWGVEPGTGRVRICGAPCQALRDSLTESAAFFAALGEAAPRIPVVASLPCIDPDRFVAP